MIKQVIDRVGACRSESKINIYRKRTGKKDNETQIGGIGLNEDDCEHDAQKKRTLRNMLASEHAEKEKGEGDWRLTVLPPLTTNLFEGLITDDGFL